MDKKIKPTVNCACVIHGTAYDWSYVDRLYSMVSRQLNYPIVMHVYTEASRPVPLPYVKHCLDDWSIGGAKRSWWYKMQMFNSTHYSGPLLYFDLDTVIVNDISWILNCSTDMFWGVRDFKYLWKPHLYNINSSVMWWDTSKFDWVWQNFKTQDLTTVIRRYHGDQDFITEVIPQHQRRCFNPTQVQSWRWECLDGGYDFKRRKHKNPGTGTKITDKTSILVFHGNPKPKEVQDSLIIQHWQ